MSLPDINSSTEKPHFLENSEHYSAWASYTRGILLKNNCDTAILETQPEISLDSIRESLIVSGFTPASLTTSILVKELRDDKNRQKTEMTKAIGIIHGLVASCHYNLINNKTAAEMWAILKNRFQDVAPMSITDVILRVSTKKMRDFDTVSQYCSEYDGAFNQIKGMLIEEVKVNVDSIEFVLQGMLLGNCTDKYDPLIAQLRRDWTHDTTNLSETTKILIAYARNLTVKAFHTGASNRGRAPIGSCTVPECVNRNRTRHWPDECFQKFPHLKRARGDTAESGRVKRQKNSKPEVTTSTPGTTVTTTPTVSS